jgi:hypothetical protein
VEFSQDAPPSPAAPATHKILPSGRAP